MLGPGDDCAILMSPPERICVSSDQLISGIHFDEHATPKQIAEKLIGRSLSDLAASGADAYACTLSCAFPRNYTEQQSLELCRQFISAAASFDLPIVGGDCSQAEQLVLSCTVLGAAPEVVPGRAGAKAGSQIFVSRSLGGAVTSMRHLSPKPELVLGKHLANNYSPQAMIDLSDGLDNDLRRILRASKVGARIDIKSLPVSEGCDWQQAVTEGEDYGLLVVLDSASAAAILEDNFFQDHPLFCVGFTTIMPKLIYLDQESPQQLQAKPFSY